MPKQEDGNGFARKWFKLIIQKMARPPMVIVPSVVESTLSLGDGSTGADLSKALQFDQEQVANLYTHRAGEFCFSFQEHGVAYNETEASDCRTESTLKVSSGSPGFSLRFDGTTVEKWGINFAGTVHIKHSSGEEQIIYLPGTRTYDPAGLTGDPHASERIGPSCSRTQTGISLGQLMAALKGAELQQLGDLQEQLRPMVQRYHGRECLFDWMQLQIEEAVYLKQEVTPYPEFIKAQLRKGKLELNEARQHTRAFLETYNSGQPQPPLQYYKKVAAKDKVDAIFSPTQLEEFQKIVHS